MNLPYCWWQPEILWENQLRLVGKIPLSATGFTYIQNGGEISKISNEPSTVPSDFWQNLRSPWPPFSSGCQWSFLVPLMGGRYHIIPQLAVYTTYIPLIYYCLLLGDYISPTTYWGNQKQLLIFYRTDRYTGWWLSHPSEQHSEKWDRQIGSFPQIVRDEHKKYSKPPLSTYPPSKFAPLQH